VKKEEGEVTEIKSMVGVHHYVHIQSTSSSFGFVGMFIMVVTKQLYLKERFKYRQFFLYLVLLEYLVFGMVLSSRNYSKKATRIAGHASWCSQSQSKSLTL